MPSRGLTDMKSIRRNSPRGRSGFTLIELMIVVVLLGLIGTMLISVLVRQQRFHRAVASVTDSRARMRDVSTILPSDIRSISTAGDDILAISDTSMQFRAFIGTSIVCRYDPGNGRIIELPPQILTATKPANSDSLRSSVLTAWITPPIPNDVAFIYNDGAEGGNIDDSWTSFAITDTTSAANSAWCPSTNTPPFTTAADNGARRYRITLSAAPNQAQVKVGAVIRFAREVRYSIYQATDNQWYVGYQTCTADATFGLPGTCGTREVLAGPVKAATGDTLTSGLFFVYWNKSGTRMTALSASDTIARINVGIRTTSESLRSATATKTNSFTGGDSLRFSIGLRNRL
jgi:prepilin-type N-terminal cleavage/methylation domain-containing protein